MWPKPETGKKKEGRSRPGWPPGENVKRTSKDIKKSCTIRAADTATKRRHNAKVRQEQDRKKKQWQVQPKVSQLAEEKKREMKIWPQKLVSQQQPKNKKKS